MTLVFQLAFIGVYALFCGIALYFCAIADPDASKMAYLLQVAVPNKLWNMMSKVVGQKRMGFVQRLLDLAFAMVYFAVVLGCWTIVFFYIYPWISRSQHVSDYNKYVGYVVFLACFGSWRLANKSKPGTITSINFKRYDHYPYDNLMFVQGKRCNSTKLLRIPRSKFDRMIYNQNVPRYDHYCGWVYNTIGEENYRWFLLFLTIHVVMCIYGSTILLLLFRGEIVDKKLFQITFFDRSTGEHVQANWFIICQYLFSRNLLESSVLAVMAVMSIALGAFLMYHFYITSRNRTTNEDAKWSDIHTWYKKEQKKYKDAVKKGLVPSSDEASEVKPEVKDGDVTCTGGGAGIKQDTHQEPPEFFDPGPVPENIYDRGFIENWKEVLFPLSLRKDARELGGYSRPKQNDSAAATAQSSTPASSSQKND